MESSPREVLGGLKTRGGWVLLLVAERLQVPKKEMTQWCLWAAEATESLKEFPVPKPGLKISFTNKVQE